MYDSPADQNAQGRAVRRGISLCAWAMACALALPADQAAAADWPDFSALRGTVSGKSAMRWDGIYFGAHVGLANMNTNFGNSTSSLVAFSLRNTTVENEYRPSDWAALPNTTTNSKTFGAFIGYNIQSDVLVYGVDLTYTRVSSLETSATDNIGRIVTTTDTYANTVDITAQSSLRLIDYASVRGRIGYAVNQFLPYVVFGAAVGRFNYATTATTTVSGVSPTATPATYGPNTDTRSNSRDNAITGGAVFGLGLDVAIMPNLFLRGEWEFIAFAPVGGIRATVNTGKVGIALRF